MATLTQAEVDFIKSLDVTGVPWPSPKTVWLKREGVSKPKGVYNFTPDKPALDLIELEIASVKEKFNALIFSLPLLSNPVTAATALPIVQGSLPFVISFLVGLGIPIPSVLKKIIKILMILKNASSGSLEGVADLNMLPSIPTEIESLKQAKLETFGNIPLNPAEALEFEGMFKDTPLKI